MRCSFNLAAAIRADNHLRRQEVLDTVQATKAARHAEQLERARAWDRARMARLATKGSES